MTTRESDSTSKSQRTSKSGRIDPKQDAFRETTLEVLEWIKTYRTPILGAIAAVLVIVIIVSYVDQSKQATIDEAWASLADLDRRAAELSPVEDADAYADLLAEYDAMLEGEVPEDVAAWVRLSYANKLHARGRAGDLEETKGILADLTGTEVTMVADLARAKLDDLEKEMAFEPPSTEVRRVDEAVEPEKEAPAEDEEAGG